MEESFSSFQPHLKLGGFQGTQQNPDPQIYFLQIYTEASQKVTKIPLNLWDTKYIHCNHWPPSQQHQPRLTAVLSYIWNAKKHAWISSTPSLKHMFLEVSQSLWDVLQQMFMPGREESKSQVTEVISFLRGYRHPMLAKLFPATWFIKLWGCTESVVFEHRSTVCEGGTALLPKAPFLRGTEVWHLPRQLVLCQHTLLENRKEITTDKKSKHFEHHWTLFRGKKKLSFPDWQLEIKLCTGVSANAIPKH